MNSRPLKFILFVYYYITTIAYSNSEIGINKFLTGQPIGFINSLDPLIFCLAIHSIIQALLPLVLWMTLPMEIQNYWSPVTTNLSAWKVVLLDLNFIKCEHASKSIALTYKPIGQFHHCTTNNATLLGASLLLVPAIDSALERKLYDLKRAFERCIIWKEHLNACGSF